MTLGGESGRLRGAVLVGSASALRQVESAHVVSGLTLLGAAVIGAGDVKMPVLARAPAWEALEIPVSEADVIVLAEAAPSRAAARRVLEQAAASRQLVMLIDGALRRLRIDDLIGRTLDGVDWEGVRARIAGSRVLVTGGGGSIGGELARRISGLGPSRLCLLDSSEYNLFQIGRELPDASIALADVRDADSVRRWFARERRELVFHAAALKQVPLVEAHPSEGVLTNVGGCRNVADAAHAIGADLVFVSTDKAVNPSGAMGASKRLGEMYCQALDRHAAERGGPRALPVRLGNVLGSAGSVAPIFASQLAAGGPLTVTDAEVTRYFISIPQAADFLLQASAAADAHTARGAAFVLDMGEPMAVVDLARKLIELQGKRPAIDVPITFVGLRPGEKLHEQLVADDEWREPDPAPDVMAAASEPRGLADLRETIDRLMLLARAGDDAGVVALLKQAVEPLRAREPVAKAG